MVPVLLEFNQKFIPHSKCRTIEGDWVVGGEMWAGPPEIHVYEFPDRLKKKLSPPPGCLHIVTVLEELVIVGKQYIEMYCKDCKKRYFYDMKGDKYITDSERRTILWEAFKKWNQGLETLIRCGKFEPHSECKTRAGEWIVSGRIKSGPSEIRVYEFPGRLKKNIPQPLDCLHVCTLFEELVIAGKPYIEMYCKDCEKRTLYDMKAKKYVIDSQICNVLLEKCHSRCFTRDGGLVASGVTFAGQPEIHMYGIYGHLKKKVPNPPECTHVVTGLEELTLAGNTYIRMGCKKCGLWTLYNPREERHIIEKFPNNIPSIDMIEVETPRSSRNRSICCLFKGCTSNRHGETQIDAALCAADPTTSTAV